MAEVAVHASSEETEKKYVGSAKPDVPSKWDQTTLHSGMMQQQEEEEEEGLNLTRKDKRKCLKKLKRKAVRREAAIKERALEESWLNDPEEQQRLQLQEQAEAQESERARILFADSERIWLQNYTRALEEEQARQKQQQEETLRRQQEEEARKEEQEDWEYVEEGPAEIIWKGNEIIVKKRQVKVPKRKTAENTSQESEKPFSNPLPPQHAAYSDYKENLLSNTGHKVFDGIEDQIPNFGTEQDKAHCPFHIKTGVCRFGTRCSRAHFYPDKSCTLLMKNMYYGPGLTFEQDEGLEVCDARFLSSLNPHSDEEVALHYFEFYEDVHTEFLKFGELVNFKVCRNASSHLRGNVYVHYQSLDSAIDAYKSLNGRFYGGKQITCEFVGVTKWKVAICGEYLKSRHKTCSRGSTCNFLHCFHNPGGEYDWADWDKRPPRSWTQKMDVLFGSSRASAHDGAQRSRVNDTYSRKHRHTHKASSRRANCHQKDSWSSEKTNVNESYSVASKYSSSDDETYITRDGNREKFDMQGSRANKKGSKYSRTRIEKEESSTAGRRHRHRHTKHHRQHNVTADQSRRKHGKSYESDNKEQSSTSNVKKRPSSEDDDDLDERYTKSSKIDSHKHKSHTRQRHSSISSSSRS